MDTEIPHRYITISVKALEKESRKKKWSRGVNCDSSEGEGDGDGDGARDKW